MYSDYREYSGGSALPTTFDNTTESKVIGSAPSGGILLIINTTAYPLAVFVGTLDVGQVPSSTLPGRCFFVTAAPSGASGGEIVDRLKVKQGDSVWVRTMNGSAVTSGAIYVSII